MSRKRHAVQRLRKLHRSFGAGPRQGLSCDHDRWTNASLRAEFTLRVKCSVSRALDGQRELRRPRSQSGDSRRRLVVSVLHLDRRRDAVNRNSRPRRAARRDRPGYHRVRAPASSQSSERANRHGVGYLPRRRRTPLNLFANRSPTLANRSLLSAPGNGFQEAETGGAETRKPRASAQPETQDLRNRRAKSLNRRAVWQSVQETRWEQSAWWARQDSNLQPERYQRQAPTFVSNGGGAKKRMGDVKEGSFSNLLPPQRT